MVAIHLVVRGRARHRAVDVEETVGRIVRVEGEAEQPAFAGAVDRDIQERRCQQLPGIEVQNPDRAGLLDDEQVIGVARRRVTNSALVSPLATRVAAIDVTLPCGPLGSKP